MTTCLIQMLTVTLATMLAGFIPVQHPAGHPHEAMGFDPDKATHHFLLAPTGGDIRVQAKDPADHATRAMIRAHLRQIAREFANGVFDKPFTTHGEMPPGVSDMQRLKQAISYDFTEIDNGGRVRITTKDARALEAVHAFLRYQIKEHRTGDPTQHPGSAPSPEHYPTFLMPAAIPFTVIMNARHIRSSASALPADARMRRSSSICTRLIGST